MSNKLTTDQFIDKANIIHNYKYNYDHAVYVSRNNKIIIICPIHGQFEQLGRYHLDGSGCKKCAIETNRNITKCTTEDFIVKSKTIHGERFVYDKVNYVNNYTKVIIICRTHGEWLQKPTHHLEGYGCPKCQADAQRLNTDIFVDKANKIHNNEYCYDNTIYIDSKSKVEIICKSHGSWFVAADNHLQGKGCPSCGFNISKTETAWLDSLQIKERQVILTINGEIFKVDGFDPITNTIYEFNGDFWHGNPNKFDPNSINDRNGIKFGELYAATLRKENILKENGFIVISIWESDWKNK